MAKTVSYGPRCRLRRTKRKLSESYPFSSFNRELLQHFVNIFFVQFRLAWDEDERLRGFGAHAYITRERSVYEYGVEMAVVRRCCFIHSGFFFVIAITIGDCYRVISIDTKLLSIILWTKSYRSSAATRFCSQRNFASYRPNQLSSLAPAQRREPCGALKSYLILGLHSGEHSHTHTTVRSAVSKSTVIG